jgi:large subunit ribosomal protein L22
MEVTAKLSNLRTAPRKVRLAADLVRGKDVPKAQAILLFTVSKPGKSILKLLNSAVASAKHNHQLDENNLFISKITVDEGPKLKRWHPMSRGRAYPILKRTSHIAIVLSERNPAKKEEAKKAAQPKAEASLSPRSQGEAGAPKGAGRKTVKKTTVKKVAKKTTKK